MCPDNMNEINELKKTKSFNISMVTMASAVKNICNPVCEKLKENRNTLFVCFSE